MCVIYFELWGGVGGGRGQGGQFHSFKRRVGSTTVSEGSRVWRATAARECGYELHSKDPFDCFHGNGLQGQ